MLLRMAHLQRSPKLHFVEIGSGVGVLVLQDALNATISTRHLATSLDVPVGKLFQGSTNIVCCYSSRKF